MSKTSSSEEFINEINPKYSIISVSKNNRYGHPNYSVLDNLEDSKLYRIVQERNIVFEIKNNKLPIETCVLENLYKQKIYDTLFIMKVNFIVLTNITMHNHLIMLNN